MVTPEAACVGRGDGDGARFEPVGLLVRENRRPLHEAAKKKSDDATNRRALKIGIPKGGSRRYCRLSYA